MAKGAQRAKERARDPEAPPPSLGGQACEWLEYYLVHGPGDVQGEPLRLHDDLRLFIWQAYELAGERRRFSEAVLAAPKGVAKSEAAGALCCLEALGPVAFDGWDASGDPVGVPRRHAEVFIFANDADQTGNTYENVGIMLGPDTCSDELLADYGKIDIGKNEQTSTRTVLPDHRGSITPKSSAPSSKEGGRTTFAVFEESHLMTLDGLKRTHRTVRRNARKRRDTWLMHATNWYGPGERSVLEAVHDDHIAGIEDLLWWARQLPPELTPDDDTELRTIPTRQLRAMLRHVYGSAKWVDVDGIISEIRRSSTPDHEAARFYLNLGRKKQGRWQDRAGWDARTVAERLVDGDEIAIGFDGGRTTDSTWLVACRISDRLIQPLAYWERPHGPEGDGWRLANQPVDDALALAFGRFNVRLMLADPPYWRDEIERWAREWGDKVVLEFPTASLSRMGAALDRFETAFGDGLVRHTGHDALARHVLNAELEEGRNGKRLAKPAGIDPDSPRAMIDGAVATVLAHEAAALALDLDPNGPVELDGSLMA